MQTRTHTHVHAFTHTVTANYPILDQSYYLLSIIYLRDFLMQLYNGFSPVFVGLLETCVLNQRTTAKFKFGNSPIFPRLPSVPTDATDAFNTTVRRQQRWQL